MMLKPNSGLRIFCGFNHASLLRKAASRPSRRRRHVKSLGSTCSLAASTSLARRRATHTASEHPIFMDPFAAALAAQCPVPTDNSREEADAAALDIIATRFIDTQLLTALSLVNMDLREEYRQVVLCGCGMDTRPFRLLWPEGILLFEIAPQEVHQTSQMVLKEQQARIPRGCLLQRIPCDLQAGEMFVDALESSGYRSDRLSVWGLQGLDGMAMSSQATRELITHISLSAAFGSVILGELPSMPKKQAQELLGEHGMLGRVIPFGSDEEDTGSGIWSKDAGEQGGDDDASSRWLFTCQHKQLSAREMDVYTAHGKAAEETDEDFFDNFS